MSYCRLQYPRTVGCNEAQTIKLNLTSLQISYVIPMYSTRVFRTLLEYSVHRHMLPVLYIESLYPVGLYRTSRTSQTRHALKLHFHFSYSRIEVIGQDGHAHLHFRCRCLLSIYVTILDWSIQVRLEDIMTMDHLHFRCGILYIHRVIASQFEMAETKKKYRTF